MAVLAAQQITRAGLAPALTAASAGGDEFSPSANRCLLVRNASAGAVTVTAVTPGTSGGLGVDDVVVSVPAGADRYIGNVSDDVFKNVNGNVGITYSAVASVTVAVLAL